MCKTDNISVKSGTFKLLELTKIKPPGSVPQGLKETVKGVDDAYEPILYVGTQLLDYGETHTLARLKTTAARSFSPFST